MSSSQIPSFDININQSSKSFNIDFTNSTGKQSNIQKMEAIRDVFSNAQLKTANVKNFGEADAGGTKRAKEYLLQTAEKLSQMPTKNKGELAVVKNLYTEIMGLAKVDANLNKAIDYGYNPSTNMSPVEYLEGIATLKKATVQGMGSPAVFEKTWTKADNKTKMDNINHELGQVIGDKKAGAAINVLLSLKPKNEQLDEKLLTLAVRHGDANAFEALVKAGVALPKDIDDTINAKIKVLIGDPKAESDMLFFVNFLKDRKAVDSQLLFQAIEKADSTAFKALVKAGANPAAMANDTVDPKYGETNVYHQFKQHLKLYSGSHDPKAAHKASEYEKIKKFLIPYGSIEDVAMYSNRRRPTQSLEPDIEQGPDSVVDYPKRENRM